MAQSLTRGSMGAEQRIRNCRKRQIGNLAFRRNALKRDTQKSDNSKRVTRTSEDCRRLKWALVNQSSSEQGHAHLVYWLHLVQIEQNETIQN